MAGGDNHYDCLLLGAGISGIDVAYHLQKHSPWASFLILERRSNIGGTWDFFKYPGIRSDSDMFTFGSVNVVSDYSCFYTEQTDINVYFGGFDNHAICKAFFFLIL